MYKEAQIGPTGLFLRFSAHPSHRDRHKRVSPVWKLAMGESHITLEKSPIQDTINSAEIHLGDMDGPNPTGFAPHHRIGEPPPAAKPITSIQIEEVLPMRPHPAQVCELAITGGTGLGTRYDCQMEGCTASPGAGLRTGDGVTGGTDV